MQFSKNAVVQITTLQKEGIIVGKSKAGVYSVLVGNLTIHCAASDLKQLNAKKPKPIIPSPKVKSSAKKVKTTSGSRSAAVDLHGMTVEEAVSVVQRKVDQAITADFDRLDIVHGLGSGKLKSAVHRYLSTLGVVKKFKIADGNPGVTWVFF